MEDQNELASLLEQIQAASADALSALNEVNALKNDLNESKSKIAVLEGMLNEFSIVDDSGIVSGFANSWKFNFSNLPDPIVSATVDCETDPPTITINVTT